jgi:hypothetical protein
MNRWSWRVHLSQANRTGYAIPFKPFLIIGGIVTAALALRAKKQVASVGFQHHRAILCSIVVPFIMISILIVLATISELGEYFPWPLPVGVPLLIVLYDIRLKRSPRYPNGHCQTCGYNLTGNVSGRCSECGSQIRVESA